MQTDSLRLKKVLLLVSGGPDSVYLFHQFIKLKESEGVEFAVLHVNHGLRGTESDGDEQFVRALCGENGILCVVKHLKLKSGGNLQDQARRERRRLCFELQRDAGYEVAVTAHHADDAFETLLMRYERGVGMSGLCGIRRWSSVKNPFSKGRRLKFFRPLLDVTKVQILAELEAEKKSFRTDSSNLSDKYFRNRVRKSVKCVTGADHLQKNILSLSRALQCVDDCFRRQTASLLKRYRHFVPIEEWKSWTEEIQFRFFSGRMRGNGYHQQIEKKHFSMTMSSEVKFVLGNAYFFKDASGCFFYSRTTLSEMKTLRVIRSPGAYLFGPWEKRIVIQKGEVGPEAFPLTVSAAGEFGSSPLKSTYVVDGTKRVSLKEWFYENGVAKYARLLSPVLRDQKGLVFCQEKGRLIR